MKHRSIGAFVLLAAALFAIPEALQDIRSLKGAILDRARGEILQAFLSFSTGDDEPCTAPRTRQARPVYASGDTGAATLASAARKRPAREAVWAPARGAEGREPREPADLFTEEGDGTLLIASAFAEVVVEAAREVGEESPAEVASLSLPRDARALETVLASAPSANEWQKVVAAAGSLRRAEDALKFDLQKRADYERLTGVRDRVRHLRVVRPEKMAPLAPEAPLPFRQVACDDPAAAAATDDATEASEEETKW